MYPVRRQIYETLRARRATKLKPWEPHVNGMRAWPWDIDPLGDLNNGRILTLSDVGRIALARRIGLIDAMTANGWRIAMAGSTPQYRKRVTLWARLTWHNRLIGMDEKFLYIEHTLFANGVPSANIMTRSVIVQNGKLVPTAEVAAALGCADWRPLLPEWVVEWAAADDKRPYPFPEMTTDA
ncbi:MAG: acyl-CoA thioesterase [Pseudomonadota bacterium]